MFIKIIKPLLKQIYVILKLNKLSLIERASCNKPLHTIPLKEEKEQHNENDIKNNRKNKDKPLE